MRYQSPSRSNRRKGVYHGTVRGEVRLVIRAAVLGNSAEIYVLYDLVAGITNCPYYGLLRRRYCTEILSDTKDRERPVKGRMSTETSHIYLEVITHELMARKVGSTVSGRLPCAMNCLRVLESELTSYVADELYDHYALQQRISSSTKL